MYEIEKLRKRLGNIHKNATEYRMTVVEAKQLLSEIDNLKRTLEKPEETVLNETTSKTQIIMDGGAL